MTRFPPQEENTGWTQQGKRRRRHSDLLSPPPKLRMMALCCSSCVFDSQLTSHLSEASSLTLPSSSACRHSKIELPVENRFLSVVVNMWLTASTRTATLTNTHKQTAFSPPRPVVHICG